MHERGERSRQNLVGHRRFRRGLDRCGAGGGQVATDRARRGEAGPHRSQTLDNPFPGNGHRAAERSETVGIVSHPHRVENVAGILDLELG